MDLGQSFIFSQSSLMSSSFCAFEDMRQNGELIDFKLHFGSRSIVGHKVILAAAIPYFRKMFSHSAQKITLEEVEPEALESVIDFAYNGRIRITFENARSLLSASKFLQLDEVYDACWEFLENGLEVKYAWSIRSLAENHCRLELVATVDNYIRQNFELFSELEDFCELPCSYLSDVLSKDDVKVSKEEKVFEALMRWVRISPTTRKLHLPDMLNKIRFAHLSLKYLIERVSREELVQDSSQCRNLVNEAKQYHLISDKPLCCSFPTWPRMYDTELQNAMRSCGLYAVCKLKSSILVKMLDFRGESWQNLSSLWNTCLDNVVAYNETIYIFLRETIVILDVNDAEWTLENQVHDPAYSSGIVMHNGKIYLFGGEEKLSDKVRCFDPQLNKWLKEETMAKNCENPGVASSGGYIYVTGGDFEGHVYKSAACYDPQTLKWMEISEMLSERVCHGCASLNGKIYGCGGYDGHYKNLKTVEVYDPFVNQWNFISPMKVTLWRISVVSNNGKLYAIERTPTSNSINVQIYEPECDQWKFDAPIDVKEVCEIFLVNAELPKNYDPKDGPFTFVAWNVTGNTNISDDESSRSEKPASSANGKSNGEKCSSISSEGTSDDDDDWITTSEEEASEGSDVT